MDRLLSSLPLCLLLVCLPLSTGALHAQEGDLEARLEAAVARGDEGELKRIAREHEGTEVGNKATETLGMLAVDMTAWLRAREDGSEGALEAYLQRGYGWHQEEARAALAELALEARRAEARERLPEVRETGKLLDLLPLLVEARPVLLGTVDVRSPVAEGGWLQLVEQGRQVAYAAEDGAIAVYEVATGKRRRAVKPGRRGRELEPPVFRLDDAQRRVALIDGRDVVVLEWPVLDEVEDCKVTRGLDVGPADTAFFGRALFALPGNASVRVVRDRGMKTVSLPGTPVSMWGNPGEAEILAWCSGEDGADLTLVRVREDRWQVDALTEGVGGDAARAAIWSPDGSATAYVAGAELHVIDTESASARSVALDAPAVVEANLGEPLQSCRLEVITRRGRHAVFVREPGGERIVLALEDEPRVTAEFYLPPVDGAEAPAYHAAGDRWVALSADRRRIHVFGPPGR